MFACGVWPWIVPGITSLFSRQRRVNPPTLGTQDILVVQSSGQTCHIDEQRILENRHVSIVLPLALLDTECELFVVLW